MPRYLVLRTFADGFELPPLTAEGSAAYARIAERNMEERVSWVQSFVSTEQNLIYCLYDAPSPEAIRRAGLRNGLPVDRITEIRVLDPYFFF